MSGFTGGCQCGAVRFRVDGELGEASICHCRMCQKATGGLFGPYAGVTIGDLIWTRGARKRFQSSNKVWRGFCGDCGTPLTFEHETTSIALAMGAFDRPSNVRLVEQLASSARLVNFDELGGLPERAEDEPKAAAYLASIVSYQHPDHDTEVWSNPAKSS